MTYINVPLFNDNNLSCGQKTLKQILAFKKYYLSNSKILNLLNSKAKENIDLPSIAIALNKKGLNVKLYLDFSEYIKKNTLTAEDLKEYIKHVNSKRKLAFLNKLVELDKLSILEPIKLEERNLIKLIKENLPLITVVKSSVFSEGKIIGDSQHIIVINGITETQCIFTSSKMFKKDLKLSLNSIMSARVPCILTVEND